MPFEKKRGSQEIVLVPSEISKGKALLMCMRKINAKQALYFGDSNTDEEVFGLEGVRVKGVRIGKSLRSDASYYIHGTGEMGRAIMWLIERDQSS